MGKAPKKARSQVQDLLCAEHDSEIIFTSCGTESDSTAILSALKAQPDCNTVITTVVEHPAILNQCEWLEKEGYIVHPLKVDNKGPLAGLAAAVVTHAKQRLVSKDAPRPSTPSPHWIPKIMLNAQQMRTLPDFFNDIPDHRRAEGRRHRLPVVLGIAAGATLCGMRGYKAISGWAKSGGSFRYWMG